MTAAQKETPKKASKKRATKRPKKQTPPSEAPSEPATTAAATATYRERMRLVGELLNASLQELIGSRSGADRLGRAAYLHIIGQVFEALDGLSQALPLDDLVKLSKIVAEQRRAEVSTRKVEPEDGEGSRKADADNATHRTGRNGQSTPAQPQSDDFETRRLPAHFGEIVRQIYGASFAEDIEKDIEMGPAQTNNVDSATPAPAAT